jgi:hypothetical protein
MIALLKIIVVGSFLGVYAFAALGWYRISQICLILMAVFVVFLVLASREYRVSKRRQPGPSTSYDPQRD